MLELERGVGWYQCVKYLDRTCISTRPGVIAEQLDIFAVSSIFSRIRYLSFGLLVVTRTHNVVACD